jgi:hypothetical protein
MALNVSSAMAILVVCPEKLIDVALLRSNVYVPGDCTVSVGIGSSLVHEVKIAVASKVAATTDFIGNFIAFI